VAAPNFSDGDRTIKFYPLVRARERMQQTADMRLLDQAMNFSLARPVTPGEIAKSAPAKGSAASSSGCMRYRANVIYKVSSLGPPNARQVGLRTGISITRSIRPIGV
jgi:hypothetical protein